MHDLQDLFRMQSAEKGEKPNESTAQFNAWHAQGSTFTSGQGVFSAPDIDVLNGSWASEEELAQLLEGATDEEYHAPAGFTSHEMPLARHRHRKIRRAALQRKLTRTETLSFLVAAVTATIVAMVSVLGGMIAHDPLRHLASPDAPSQMADWWPLLVYGPWMVASLSILRAALHRRRAPHSWCVVLLFSAFAILFCVACARRTITDAAVASLPAIAALSCFHQLVRQITLTRPPVRVPSSRRETQGDS